MKRYRKVLISLAIAVGIFTAPISTSAISVFDGTCGGSSTAPTGGVGGSAGAPSTTNGSATTDLSGTASGGTICTSRGDDFSTIMKNIINTILVVLGIVAVIMIIIGGIRYTTSNGDSSAIQGAKNTILYAVVGLVVAILAYAIVNFVIGRLS